jgi:predicted ATPase
MHRTAGGNLFFSGDVAAALPQFEQAIALGLEQRDRSRARHATDPVITLPPWIVLGLWLLGYPDQALQREQAALASARKHANPFDLAFFLLWTTLFRYCRREPQVVSDRLDELITLGTERGFAQLLAIGKALQGANMTARGHGQEGIAQMRQALDAHQTTGARLHRVCLLTLLAETLGKAGQPEAGLTVLSEAIALGQQTEERYYIAELHRLRGELFLACSSPDLAEAETCFHQALNVARAQQAKSWELRAATSLARLWQSQDKRQDAYDLLAPVYGWFTEGFDTADLQEAKGLLAELA